MSSAPTPSRILVVDDEEIVLSVIKQQLQPEGFEVTAVNSATKALEALERDEFSVIIADQEMPGMSGLDFLSKVADPCPGMTRLLLSSTLTVKDLADAIKSNLIHRFLAKPWLREELLVVVRNAFALHLADQSLSLTATGGAAVEPAAAATADQPDGSSEASASSAAQGGATVLDAFISMLRAYHPNLGNTALRTTALCRKVAEILELPPAEAQNLVWAAGLHDISLVGVDRGITRRWLRSPEKCTDQEMILIKKHPQETVDMLANYPEFKAAGDIIVAHHENWDGTGYPHRLKGEAIPWLSRVLAVAIYFCNKHQAPAQVLTDVQSQTDKMFDPQAVEVVAKAVPLTELPRGEREILLIELQAGMVLAGDIYNAGGVLIIAKGRELTMAWINKIHNINNATPLNPLVLVYC
ncbi:MAG: response regulator [Verrucomicrobia bacterium]|nr:response regulator [Verrucomicrobiota bacterium]